MRRVWPAVLATALVTACGGDEPDDPAPASPTASPRPEIGTWTPLADLPRKRSELSAVALDGVVYAGGGIGVGGGRYFYSYDPESDTWTERTRIPDGRNHAPITGHDGLVYMVGGHSDVNAADGTFQPVDTLSIYDPATDTWRDGPALPGPLGAHAVATTDDGMIHVVGGIAQSSSFAASAEHYVFDTATETWSTLPPLPTAREHLGAAYLDGVIYTVAGRGGGGGVAFEAYDIETEEWSTLPDLPTSRGGVATVAFDGEIYVLGGETFNPDRAFDTAERFDPQAGVWQEVSPMPSGRHGLGAAVLDDGIVVVAGGPEPGFSYSAETVIWRP